MKKWIDSEFIHFPVFILFYKSHLCDRKRRHQTSAGGGADYSIKQVYKKQGCDHYTLEKHAGVYKVATYLISFPSLPHHFLFPLAFPFPSPSNPFPFSFPQWGGEATLNTPDRLLSDALKNTTRLEFAWTSKKYLLWCGMSFVPI